MTKFKLKLKEAAPNLAQQGNYKIGDITYSKDGDTRFEVDISSTSSSFIVILL